MYSPRRVWSLPITTAFSSIKLPESPIEQPTFRFRSLRRLVTISCCLFLCFIALHTGNHRKELAPQIVSSYRSLHKPDLSTWKSRSQRVDFTQGALETPSTTEGQIGKLPEVVRNPFEEAVSDIVLQGWEDKWLSSATFDREKYGPLSEPKIDFIYNWVNGSEKEFNDIKHQYELISPLNDASGKWLSKHSINRYRDWDELRYSFRSLNNFAQSFINKIQLLVNSVPVDAGSGNESSRAQRPNWLKDDEERKQTVQILTQEDFFWEDEKACLPSFDSVSIESQIHNTLSSVDQFVALSDDMLLGAPHSAADFFSPLFGSVMGFKPDQYNVKDLSKAYIPTFGEKPYLYYTSWLLNHRFGERDRKVQAHFPHSISRKVMKETMNSFPSPAVRGACERFRGESKYQIYPWYAAFHYSIERFREVLLWSFVMTRGDANGDGYLDWIERQAIVKVVKQGMHAVGQEDDSTPARAASGRERLYYKVPQVLLSAGLEPPMSNINVLWASLDGPATIKNLKCHRFNVAKCFGESFDSPLSDTVYQNPDFSAANVFSHLSRRDPICGDCLTKFLLSTVPMGLEPMLPPKKNVRDREVVVKSLVKYQHTVIEPEGMFVMVKDAEQAEQELLERAVRRKKHVSQWCLNDDVMTDDAHDVAKVNDVMQTVFQTLFPVKSRWEI